MSEEVKNKSEYLVEVRDLKQYFPIKTGFMKTTPLKAGEGVSFSTTRGETLGLVGESGGGTTPVGDLCCVCIHRPPATSFSMGRE